MYPSLHSIITNKLNLSESYYDRLLEISDLRSFSSKKHLLNIGNTCSFLGFVEKGYLRSYREKDGEEFISDFLHRSISEESAVSFAGSHYR